MRAMFVSVTGRLVMSLFLAVPGLSAAAESDNTRQPEWQVDTKRATLLDVDRPFELPTQVWAPAPGDTSWPYYNNTAAGSRFVDLADINVTSIRDLAEVCRVEVSGPGPFPAGPILVNGVLYTTAAQATMAIHPATCAMIWKSIYSLEESEIYNANRGLAWLDGRLYRGTGDGRLVSYDAATGRELWHEKVTEPKNGEYVVGAPVAWDGKVYIGKATGDMGIVGRIMAFDAATGGPVWHFNTVAQPGEYGHETWAGDSWKTGGGGTWSSFALDPATGELFVPVANPSPAFDHGARKGANLFTSSVVALDARTGKRLWHYQTRPGDNHDYGHGSPPILFNIGARQVVAQGSKDGFLYLIDRTTHRLIWKTPVSTILNHDADATEEGVKICPGAKGGVSYNSPAYDPVQNLLIVGSIDWCYKLRKEAYGPHVPGNPFMGGRMDRADDSGTGWITAVDAKTGKVRWRHHAPAPVIAGITPTSGGVTFAGDAAGNLYVFRTEDGLLLRTIPTGGALAGGIITYRIRGRQYLAVNSGNISRSSWGAMGGTPTLIVYGLPQATVTPPAQIESLAPDPAHGRVVYERFCQACHGPQGRGGEGPPLKGIANKFSQAGAAAYIANPTGSMPRLFPDVLSAQDVADTAAWIHGLAMEQAH